MVTNLQQRSGLIFLVGMMGSGKSTQARRIAELLGYEYIDLDLEIELRTGRSILEIFVDEGEAGFRDLERVTLDAICADRQRCVVATGGGTPCFHDGMDKMLASGWVIYLKTDLETLYQRLESERDSRPLLKEPNWKQRLATLYTKRRNTYERAHNRLS